MPQILKNILVSHCWTWHFTDGYGFQETNFHNIDDDEREKLDKLIQLYLFGLSLYNYFFKKIYILLKFYKK